MQIRKFTSDLLLHSLIILHFSSFEFVAMALQALKCSALTELKSDVEVLSVDDTGISVSGDGVTHVFLHGPKIYEVKPLQSKIRVILKQMIKQVSLFSGFL
jgi:hypothetical protein